MNRPLTMNSDSEASTELPVLLWWLSGYGMIQQKKKKNYKKSSPSSSLNNHNINSNIWLQVVNT